MKLGFEIAVDQQTRARDRTFERVPDSGCPPVHAGQPRPYWSISGPILPNHLNMLKTISVRDIQTIAFVQKFAGHFSEFV